MYWARLVIGLILLGGSGFLIWSSRRSEGGAKIAKMITGILLGLPGLGATISSFIGPPEG